MTRRVDRLRCISARTKELAGGLRIVPRAHGKKSGTRNVGPMARRTSLVGRGARLAGQRRQPKCGDSIRNAHHFSLRAMDRARAMARDQAYAEERGVALMGDIPFGVSYYSADVFSRPDEFALDWSGGAPPEPYFKDDEFTQKWGQNWGIPLYRWDVMRSDNFAWWRQRVRGVQNFSVFRIDHVLGFYRIYAFPWRPTRNQEFLPLDLGEMRNVPAAANRTLLRATIPLGKLRGETTAKAKNICASCWRKRVRRESSAKILGTVPQICAAEFALVRHRRFQDPAMGGLRRRPLIPGNEYERSPSRHTPRTITNRSALALGGSVRKIELRHRDQARHELAKIARIRRRSAAERRKSISTRIFIRRSWRRFSPANRGSRIVMITDLLGRKDRFNVPGNGSAVPTGRGGCKRRSANWSWSYAALDSFGSSATCWNETRASSASRAKRCGRDPVAPHEVREVPSRTSPGMTSM